MTKYKIPTFVSMGGWGIGGLGAIAFKFPRLNGVGCDGSSAMNRWHRIDGSWSFS
ncbi:hypothetical protein [Nostoc sp.]|uniref:hypothetical protein n=1 Tax=Nostoc sp. TaxID=1180 RepID=UPI002FF79973